LEHARSRGLESAAYPEQPFNGFSLDSTAVRDVRHSRLALRMARELHLGRIDPATVEPAWRSRARRLDDVATLRRLLAAPSVAAVFDSLEPRDRGYWALRQALPALAKLASDEPEWHARGFPRSLRLGDSGIVVVRLRARLQFLGDLAADIDAANGTVFDTRVAEAVRRFQARHGLEVDGILGPATLEALATPLSWRARQVELALERWRWFSDPGSAALIEVDVPNATLQLRDSLLGAERFGARVIVGARSTPTPMLESEVVRVVFNPDWIVPAKIAREELRPQFLASRDVLVRGGYQLLRNGTAVEPTPETIAAIGRTITVRQRPGPANALGRIKFEVAGTTAIHLHDTPGRSLFSRDLRMLSHGCIRVDQPAELAGALLGDDWPRERIGAFGADTVQVTARPPRRVAVRLTYATASVDAQGTLRFRPDRYGRDRSLDVALRQRR
jgi:murein L,D-transpeptidase YcbB/YkuD